MTRVDVGDLAELAESFARQAGELVAARREGTVTVSHTKSTAIDIVTESDTASEQLLRSLIAAQRPGDGVLGEEGGGSAGTSGVTWVIDPIDGTVNYLYGLPHYSVSVAAVTGGTDPATWRIEAGCVHAPALGHTWTAAAGLGARKDGRRLSPRGETAPDRALIATGFGYAAERKRGQGRVVARLIDQIRDIRRLGSAAIDLALVADGSLDAHFERGLNPWDFAAGALIVQESGGIVTGLRGRPAGEDMVVAGPPALASWLAGRLAELDADRDIPVAAT